MMYGSNPAHTFMTYNTQQRLPPGFRYPVQMMSYGIPCYSFPAGHVIQDPSFYWMQTPQMMSYPVVNQVENTAQIPPSYMHLSQNTAKHSHPVNGTNIIFQSY